LVIRDADPGPHAADGRIDPAPKTDPPDSALTSNDASNPTDVESAVRAVIEELRPYVEADGGTIELTAIDGDTVHVRLGGACQGCPAVAMTLYGGLEQRLRERVPGIRRVVHSG
jgi:Fe-S cluster biogenesis protein NfuA